MIDCAALAGRVGQSGSADQADEPVAVLGFARYKVASGKPSALRRIDEQKHVPVRAAVVVRLGHAKAVVVDCAALERCAHSCP